MDSTRFKNESIITLYTSSCCKSRESDLIHQTIIFINTKEILFFIFSDRFLAREASRISIGFGGVDDEFNEAFFTEAMNTRLEVEDFSPLFEIITVSTRHEIISGSISIKVSTTIFLDVNIGSDFFDFEFKFTFDDLKFFKRSLVEFDFIKEFGDRRFFLESFTKDEMVFEFVFII
jgi:hypothetical protein